MYMQTLIVRKITALTRPSDAIFVFNLFLGPFVMGTELTLFLQYQLNLPKAVNSDLSTKVKLDNGIPNIDTSTVYCVHYI